MTCLCISCVSWISITSAPRFQHARFVRDEEYTFMLFNMQKNKYIYIYMYMYVYIYTHIIHTLAPLWACTSFVFHIKRSGICFCINCQSTLRWARDTWLQEGAAPLQSHVHIEPHHSDRPCIGNVGGQSSAFLKISKLSLRWVQIAVDSCRPC